MYVNYFPIKLGKKKNKFKIRNQGGKMNNSKIVSIYVCKMKNGSSKILKGIQRPNSGIWFSDFEDTANSSGNITRANAFPEI